MPLCSYFFARSLQFLSGLHVGRRLTPFSKMLSTRATATRGSRSSVKTSAKAGQGRRKSPPEPSQNPRGPLLTGLFLNMTSSRDAWGTKSSIPKEDTPNHKHVRGAGGVSISGTIWHLSSKYQPLLASPFVGPKPVFEIKPQGIALRASPCRDRKSTRLNSSHRNTSRMPSSA